MAGSSSYGRRVVDETASEWERIKAADAQRLARAAMEAEQRDAQLAANSTEQTRNKRRKDVISELLERGDLTGEQHRAAHEVAWVWSSITSALFARGSRFGEVAGRSGADWHPSLLAAYRERYGPWRDTMSRVLVRGNVSACELVFFVACDNHGVRQTADRLNMDQRKVKRLLQSTLHAYAELAGWIDDRVPDMVSRMARTEIVAHAELTA